MKDFNMRYLKIVLLFIIVVGLTETAFGQASFPDSCICYTDTMDKQAIECLINAPKKDTLISNLSIQINLLTKRIEGKDIILIDNGKSIEELTSENQKINLHLTQARRNTKIFGAAGFGIGVVATLLLLK